MGKLNWIISDVKTKVNSSNYKQKIRNRTKHIKQSVHSVLSNLTGKDGALPFTKTEKGKKIKSVKNQVLVPKLKQMFTKGISTPQAQPLLTTPKTLQSKRSKVTSLRDRMMNKLKAARFRYINEQLYLANGKEAYQLFKEDPESFDAYHVGFKHQVTQWPINPLDVIIKSLKNRCANMVIADFGCGDAKLAVSLESATVHSFDLVALNDRVTVCNMARTPLPSESADVAVFCLSLMGTNLGDFVKEANRILKEGGNLKIAEVESRFDNVDQFVKGVEKFGFKALTQDLSHNLFYFLDFQKQSNISKRRKNKLPHLSLKPCLYKKR